MEQDPCPAPWLCVAANLPDKGLVFQILWSLVTKSKYSSVRSVNVARLAVMYSELSSAEPCREFPGLKVLVSEVMSNAQREDPSPPHQQPVSRLPLADPLSYMGTSNDSNFLHLMGNFR